MLASDPANVAARKLEKDLLRVLDSLDKTEERTKVIYEANRTHERKGLRLPLRILPPQSTHATPQLEILGYSREVSRGGLSFLSQTAINTPEIIVGLPLPNGGTNWMRAHICRSRVVQDDFMEYGISFLGKQQIEEG